MYCQVCGLKNPDEEEFCSRCHSKLLVLSGVGVVEESVETPEEIPFDEHLLERISTLEDVVKRTGDALKTLFESLGNLEKNLFVANTGILALQETLERRGALRSQEVLDLWETKMDERMQAVEKKDRFLERRDRIVARFSGEDREAFLRRLRAAELALLALGALYANSSRWPEAEEELTRALEAAPVPAAHVLLGTVLREKGEVGRAIQEFEEARRLQPDSEEAAFQLGLCYLEKNRARRALECFQQALERNPRRLEYQEAVRLLERRQRYALPRVDGPGADPYREAEAHVPRR